MKKLVLITAALVSIVCLATFALAATIPAQPKAEWEQKWEQLAASAKKEGKVVVYGNVGPLLKKNLTDGFKGRFGIEMEFVVGRPPEVATRYLQERTANVRMNDFFIAGQTTTATLLKPKGVLSPLRPQLILPEVLDSKAWPQG